MLILPTCHLLQVFYMLFRDPYSTKVQKNFVILAVEGRWSGLRWTAMRCRTSPDETRSGGFTSRSRARRTRRSPPAASSRRIQIRTRRTRTTISPCIRPCRCSRQRYVRHYMYQFALCMICSFGPILPNFVWGVRLWKRFKKWILEVPLTYLGSTAVAVHSNGQWNSYKTFYKTFFTTRLHLAKRQLCYTGWSIWSWTIEFWQWI